MSEEGREESEGDGKVIMCTRVREGGEYVNEGGREEREGVSE